MRREQLAAISSAIAQKLAVKTTAQAARSERAGELGALAPGEILSTEFSGGSRPRLAGMTTASNANTPAAPSTIACVVKCASSTNPVAKLPTRLPSVPSA